MNIRLGGMTEEVALLRQDIPKICERTMAVEGRNSNLEDKLPPLIHESRSTARLAHDKRAKADDIENRLKPNNVHIVGLPDKVEGRDPIEFVEQWLLNTFGKEAFTLLFMVERAH